MDRRLTPGNGRVAASHLKGVVDAENYVEGQPRTIAQPVADLCRAPGGSRNRQLLMGDTVFMFEERDGLAFVQAEKDGYVGYVDATALADMVQPSHWVAVPAGHIYSRPDIKSAELGELVFGNRLVIRTHMKGYYETNYDGFVPKQFLWPIEKRFTDPVTVAQMHFGAPYLWGGNSTKGIDCSGLVQASLNACGTDCPADSDLQEEALGEPLAGDEPMLRGDLIFWKGHVAMAVDGDTIIHANAHHMSVAYEPAETAIKRIEAQDGGPVTARKRLASVI